MIIDATELVGILQYKLGEMHNREAGIVLGGVKDFAEYRHSTGYIRAVDEMIEFVRKTARQHGDLSGE